MFAHHPRWMSVTTVLVAVVLTLCQSPGVVSQADAFATVSTDEDWSSDRSATSSAKNAEEGTTKADDNHGQISVPNRPLEIQGLPRRERVQGHVSAVGIKLLAALALPQPVAILEAIRTQVTFPPLPLTVHLDVRAHETRGRPELPFAVCS